MEIDNVVAELVVLGLNLLEVFAQDLIVAYLLLELLDVAFLALAERSLNVVLVMHTNTSVALT